MFKQVDRQAVRKNKHFKIRKKISGTAERPRMSVYRSLNNIFVQLIDDVNAKTLVAASTIDKELKAEIKNGGNVEAAKLVGKKVAEMGMKTIDVLMRGIGQGRESAVRGLGNAGLIVQSITDTTRIPHNGCRPKKVRRV